MRKALVKDLGELPGVGLETIWDTRLGAPGSGGRVYCVGAVGEFECVFSRAMDRADAVWPIAPETQGVLEYISQQVLAAGKSV